MGAVNYSFQECLAELEARMAEAQSLEEIEEIEALMDQETERQLILFKTTPNLSHRIALLTHLLRYLAPDRVDDLVDKLIFEASIEEDPNIQSALEDLLFTREYPIILDLEAFAQRVEGVADLVLECDSLSPMATALNRTQLEEARRLVC